MNNIGILFGATIVAAGMTLGAAQTAHHHEDGATAAPEMGMGMMTGPLQQAVTTAFVLPEFQSELGLSAQQVTQLRQMKQEMLTKGKEYSGQLEAKQKEMDALLTPGTSKGEQVKKLLEQIATLRADRLYTGYEASNRMKVALSEEQRSKLAAMKPHEFHQAMMSRMTMNDMMQMMQFVGGDGMMIGRTMMGQGIMGGMTNMPGARKE